MDGRLRFCGFPRSQSPGLHLLPSVARISVDVSRLRDGRRDLGH